jgi:hypothetical protein
VVRITTAQINPVYGQQHEEELLDSAQGTHERHQLVCEILYAGLISNQQLSIDVMVDGSHGLAGFLCLLPHQRLKIIVPYLYAKFLIELSHKYKKY